MPCVMERGVKVKIAKTSRLVVDPHYLHMDMKFLERLFFCFLYHPFICSHPTILSLVPRKNQKETSKVAKFVFEKNLKKHVLKTL